MDVIFDIDGTLANAEHRLHHIIPDPNQLYEQPFRKDWDSFLSDEAVAKDTPSPEIWHIMESLLYAFHSRVIFITGRPESQRVTTWNWLMDSTCEIRSMCFDYWEKRLGKKPILYMRTDGDRRRSSAVKEDLLSLAKMNGYNPTLVFEDRADDTAMWRRNGLLCCQVAEGNY